MNSKPTARRFRNEYFLFLLPLFFVLHGYTEHYSFIPETDVLELLGRYQLAVIIVALLGLLVFRNWRKAAVFAFTVMTFHFLFGPLHDTVKQWTGNSFITRYSFLLPAIIAGFIALVIYFFRATRTFTRFTKYINLLLLILILIDAGQLLVKMSRNKKQVAGLPQNFINCDTCSRPDIYFIIADEYAGNRELKEVFGFDNTPFENELRKRGFHITDSSVSNYNYTPFCMASTFRMEYLRGIEGKNTSSSDRKLCYSAINQNRVLQFLQSLGYGFRNYSVFQFNDELPPVQSTSFFLTGKDLITAQTFLSRLDRDIRFNLISRFGLKGEMYRVATYELNINETLFEKTKQEVQAPSEGPRFVYTHLMMPHYPYFFDRNGKLNRVEILMEGNQALQKEYIEYLQYSNGRFLELIDHIKKASKQPPIIIFMGDHGFRHFNTDVDHKYYFMNLNSVYLPGGNYAGFYKGMSSVNQFRVLFNSRFGQKLPLLKDSTSFLLEY
jgi:hypothetical protein